MAGLRLGTRGPTPRPVLERIEDHTEDAPGGCRLWTASLDDHGYPHIGVGSSVDRWTELHGPPPEGFDVHHGCENKLCIAHLELLEHGEHSRLHDNAAKARAAKAERHRCATRSPSSRTGA